MGYNTEVIIFRAPPPPPPQLLDAVPASLQPIVLKDQLIDIEGAAEHFVGFNVRGEFQMWTPGLPQPVWPNEKKN